MWFDYHNVLSYNALLNFIITERGLGKTYGATKLVINNFIKKNEEFVYLRRYKTELKTSVPKFFDAINKNNEFPDHKLTVSGNIFKCDGKSFGTAVPLSTANILKSTSFANVTTIIFDEFIIDKGCYHYLQNEVTQLLDIIETIARLRDIRVIFLGNAISITNPYFNYFNLSLPYNNDIKLFKDGLILVNYTRNSEYREIKKQSRFGKLIEGTEYGNYAIDNNFLRDSKSFIKKKSKKSKFYFILLVNGHKYGVWQDYNESDIYISKQIDPTCPVKFSITADDHNEQTILIRCRTSPFFRNILEHYQFGKLFFESQQIKNNVIDYINKISL